MESNGLCKFDDRWYENDEHQNNGDDPNEVDNTDGGSPFPPVPCRQPQYGGLQCETEEERHREQDDQVLCLTTDPDGNQRNNDRPDDSPDRPRVDLNDHALLRWILCWGRGYVFRGQVSFLAGCGAA